MEIKVGQTDREYRKLRIMSAWNRTRFAKLWTHNAAVTTKRGGFFIYFFAAKVNMEAKLATDPSNPAHQMDWLEKPPVGHVARRRECRVVFVQGKSLNPLRTRPSLVLKDQAFFFSVPLWDFTLQSFV